MFIHYQFMIGLDPRIQHSIKMITFVLNVKVQCWIYLHQKSIHQLNFHDFSSADATTRRATFLKLVAARDAKASLKWKQIKINRRQHCTILTKEYEQNSAFVNFFWRSINSQNHGSLHAIIFDFQINVVLSKNILFVLNF